jgi:hemerythrin HHE cation binding domain-containing protein
MEATGLGTLRAEHVRLGAVLDRADELLRRRADARFMALELAARLGAHLSGEAETEHLLGVGPGTNAAIGTLRTEHDELRSMLAALVRAIDEPVRPKHDEQVAVQLRDLVDLARIHLRKEHVLILAATPAAGPRGRRKESDS